MNNYTESDQNILLSLAEESINHGLHKGKALPIESSDYSEILLEDKATFVTLKIHNQLRGCIGMLKAIRPLVLDVAENAFSAAFRDPRFPAVSQNDFSSLEYQISILSTSTPIDFTNEANLLAQLKQHKDGLILKEGPHTGTFLPSVWEQLEEPREFLRHLKVKAGLPENYWSSSIQIERYSVQCFGTEAEA